MTLPRIEIYLNEQSGISIVHVRKNQDASIINLSLNRLEAAGSNDGAIMLGKPLLAILKMWHPEALQDVPAEAPMSRAEIKASVAQELIGMSISERTDFYVSTIDKLLTESSQELGTDFLINSWPVLRARIESFKTLD